MNTTIAQQIANEGGVEAYLHAQQHKSLLRFLTCGSVDDGKSTLIGRLLHDTRQIYEDQLSSLHNDSKRHGTQGEKLDLALLVDGLQAVHQQRQVQLFALGAVTLAVVVQRRELVFIDLARIVQQAAN